MLPLKYTFSIALFSAVLSIHNGNPQDLQPILAPMLPPRDTLSNPPISAAT
jgi:hypothetical protein